MISLLSSPNDLIREVVVMDELGRVLVSTKSVNAFSHDIQMSNVSPRVYVVRVVTDGETKTSKILIK